MNADGGGPDGTTPPPPNDSGSPPADAGGSGDAPVATDSPAPSPCDAGALSCGGTCVNPNTDPQNCGGCGVVCNTTCTNGVCPLIAPDSGVPPVVGDNACLTVDSANVYWGTGTTTGSVWSVPIAGGTPTQVVGNQSTPHPMASDGTNLYFGNQGTAGTCTGSIQRVPVGGAVTATPIATAQCVPLDVVVDANNVYWTNSGDGSVWKSDKTTPNPINLVPASTAGHAAYLRVDATNVYFTDTAGGVVNRVPIAGGNVTAMTTTGIPTPTHIAIDGTNAYFGSRSASGAAILSVALTASGGNTTQVVKNLATINGIQTDGTSLWFAEASSVLPYMGGTGQIHRDTVGGANDTVLASKQNGPNCISVDATSVYWINTGGGMISKTGK
jgi:hypothetical protein